MPERYESGNDALAGAFRVLNLGPGATVEQVVDAFVREMKEKQQGKVSAEEFEQVKDAFQIFSAYFKKDEKRLQELLQNNPEYIYLSNQEINESQDPKGRHIDRTA